MIRTPRCGPPSLLALIPVCILFTTACGRSGFPREEHPPVFDGGSAGSDGGSTDPDGGPDAGESPQIPDELLSELEVGANGEALADGKEVIPIHIRVLDQLGRPIRGVAVQLTAAGEGIQIEQPVETDGEGHTSGGISSTEPGPKVVAVRVASGNEAHSFSRELLVTFTPIEAPPGCLEPIQLTGRAISTWTQDPFTVGDWNRDGALDLAVANAGSHAVELWMNDGQAGFGPGPAVPLEEPPLSIVSGDVDGDGRLDLIVGDASGVRLLLGGGDGTFTVMSPRYMTGNTPSFLAIGDVNDDDRPDLIAAGGTDTVSVLFNYGEGGGFTPPIPFPAGADARALAMGDLDGDGNLDLAALNHSTGEVSVLLNHAGGAFSPPVTYGTGPHPTGLAVADLDRDGRPDLVVASPEAGTMSVHLNQGDGSLAPAAAYPSGVGAYSVAVVDLDGSGAPDLAVSNGHAGAVGILLNRGNGIFTQPVAFTVPGGTAGAGDAPSAVHAVDVDGNGMPDLIVGARGALAAMLHAGRSPLFHPPVTYPAKDATTIAVGDLNGDGWPDIVTGNYYQPRVSVLLNERAGTFAPEMTFQAGRLPKKLSVGDLTGDGWPDVAVCNVVDGGIHILPGRGDGRLGTRRFLEVGGTPTSVVIADLNGDGRRDLAVSLDAGLVAVLLNRGQGRFDRMSVYPTSPRSGSYALIAADLNRDGRPDLVTFNTAREEDKDTMSVLMNQGDGTFAPQVSYPAPVTSSRQGGGSLAAGDFDGDGWVDVVTRSTEFMAVFINRGDGSFGPFIPYDTWRSGNGVAVVDVNMDGKLDLIWSEGWWSEARLALRFGNGDGTFSPRSHLDAGEGLWSAVVEDLDRNGRPDVAIVGWRVVVLRSSCQR